jgi:hypothetical protein
MVTKLQTIKRQVAAAIDVRSLQHNLCTPEQSSGAARLLQEARRERLLNAGTTEELRTVVITDKHGKFAVDPRTGEVLLADRITPEPAPVGFHSVDNYVGMDTAWPSKATTSDALLKATAPHDRWQDKLHLAEWRLLGLLETGVSADAVRILKFLCEKLVSRNIWFGQMVEVDCDLRLAERSRKRAVAELVAARLVWVGPSARSRQTKVCVHPWYGFKGDQAVQENLLKAWLADDLPFTGAKSGTLSAPQAA